MGMRDDGLWADFRTSAETANLFKAIGEVQANDLHVVPNKKNPHYKSDYADLSAVWALLRPHLQAAKLAVVQVPVGEFELVTRVQHESGEFLEFRMRMVPDRKGPQECGKVITYAKRYALKAVFGVTDEMEDDDANSATHLPPKRDQNTRAGLSEAQIKRLYAIASSVGVSHDQIKNTIERRYGVTSTRDLSREHYDEIFKKLLDMKGGEPGES